MNLLRKIPLPLDYILGIIMILSGFHIIYNYYDFLDDLALMRDLMWNILPYVPLLFGGILLIVLPKKNIRRTIWMSGLILSLNLILMGLNNLDTYYLYQDYKLELITYVAAVFSFGMVYIGCGIAVLITSVVFAFNKTKSIYPIVIAIILSFSVDYFDLELSYSVIVIDLEEYGWDYFIGLLTSVYIPHMLLLVMFTLLFTSDEVSWYTAQGGMKRAMNRLYSTAPLFAMNKISRDQLILIMQGDSDMTLTVSKNEYVSRMDVLFHDGRRTLVFYPMGGDSQAGALYVNINSVVPEGTLADCKYVEMYGDDGYYIRLNVIESTFKGRWGRRSTRLLGLGSIPNFHFSVSNLSLNDLVEGTGRYPLKTLRSREHYEIEVVEQEGKRAAIFYKDGEVFYRMDLVATVPVCEFGEYTKLYLYGNMGKVIALKIRSFSRSLLETRHVF